MDNNKKGALLVILAGACWGTISIFIYFLSGSGLNEFQIAFVRQFFASLVFALFIFLRDRSKFRIKPKDLWLLMLVGFINGVAFNFCYFYTIVHSRASIAVVPSTSSPTAQVVTSAIGRTSVCHSRSCSSTSATPSARRACRPASIRAVSRTTSLRKSPIRSRFPTRKACSCALSSDSVSRSLQKFSFNKLQPVFLGRMEKTT